MKKYLALLAILVVGFTACQPETDSRKDVPETITADVPDGIPMDELAYKQESSRDFDELVAAVEASAAERKFTVLAKHDVHQTLTSKGMEIPRYTIIEVCNGKYAHSILSENMDVGMFLPCRIAVYEGESTNTLVMMRPTLIRTMMPDQDFGSIPEDVEATLIEVMTEAAG